MTMARPCAVTACLVVLGHSLFTVSKLTPPSQYQWKTRFLLVASTLYCASSWILFQASPPQPAPVVACKENPGLSFREAWGMRRRILLFLFPFLLVAVTASASFLFVAESRTKLSDQMDCILFVVITAMVYLGTIIVWAVLAVQRGRGQQRKLITAIFLLLLLLWWTKATGRAQQEWATGIAGARMLEPDDFPQCPVPTHLVSVMALVPWRLGNFWAGPHTCGVEPDWAWFTANRTLVVEGCPEGMAVVHQGSDYFLKSSDRDELARFASQLGPRRSTPYSKFNPDHVFDDEFVEVTCGDSKSVLLVQHVPKPGTAEGARRQEQQRQRSTGTQPAASGKAPERAPNVLFLMLDAVSRLHIKRRLPQLVQAVERAHRSGNTTLFQFFRYSIIGHSTQGNVPLFLTGHFDHPSYNQLSNLSSPRSDRYWWSDFKREHGHVTTFINDLCEDKLDLWMGGRGSHLDNEFVAWCCFAEYDNYGERTNWIGPYSFSPRCLRHRFVHSYALQYLRQAWDHYARTERVGQTVYATFTDGHEGTMEVISTMDTDLARLVDWLGAEGHLQDTVVVLGSDHGMHMGPYFMTVPGRLEQKLPLLQLLVPTAMLERYPELNDTLQHNSQSLITAWDLYATLRQLAVYPRPADRGTPDYPRGPKWAKSLLAEKVPYNRTCAEAHIPAHRCICTDGWAIG
eukprot:TRINITY_DN28717_c0_g3_i1.p1 TRINITY_DN28717_c0_g3~~TRINITY_DN28717_c0_g3_i1.p1  ORF type:complete len:692 (+),score=85.36 TRINITY_DN28717_c0_g3_i1:24-2078(+)